MIYKIWKGGLPKEKFYITEQDSMDDAFAAVREVCPSVNSGQACNREEESMFQPYLEKGSEVVLVQSL